MAARGTALVPILLVTREHAAHIHPDDQAGDVRRGCAASRHGVIEPGAAADIVTVASDPLQDIECLQQVELVIQGGLIAWDGHHLTWDGRHVTA